MSLVLLLLAAASCSWFGSKELARLPATSGPHALDSAQAEAVYERAEHFPNGTQGSMCIITGDSEKYVGILRRNDSLVYIGNSDSVFEIGSITKTFAGTMYPEKHLNSRSGLPRTMDSKHTRVPGCASAGLPF